MDASVLMQILDQWQNRKIDFPTASLKLINAGCSAAEVKALMEQYPQNPIEQPAEQKA